MQEFLCNNVVFLLQTQFKVALSQPLLSSIAAEQTFDWTLLSEQIPPPVVLEGDELYGCAALYWHRIALSVEIELNSSRYKCQFEKSIAAYGEARSHAESIRKLFQEY